MVFKNITAGISPLTVQLKGFDEGHSIENILFEVGTANGNPLTRDGVEMNRFVKSVVVKE